uniref:Uncharacterized protein n=1 Tax=Lygus hesperus TaxID=30085 RepID=A0A146LIL5_LYGHE
MLKRSLHKLAITTFEIGRCDVLCHPGHPKSMLWICINGILALSKHLHLLLRSFLLFHSFQSQLSLCVNFGFFYHRRGVAYACTKVNTKEKQCKKHNHYTTSWYLSNATCNNALRVIITTQQLTLSPLQSQKVTKHTQTHFGLCD